MADPVGNEEANRMLLEYSKNGDAKELGCVLREGMANIEIRGDYGFTGLIWASNRGNVECLKLLLAANANVNIQNEEGYTGLIWASENSNVECLKLLLAANANVNIQNEEGYTGLICASRYGRVECLKLLLAANANVDSQDENGDTGLILASMRGHVECLKLLLAANANVDSQDENGDTGLILASMRGHVECLKLLLAANANVNTESRVRYTGLIWASINGHVECLKLLLVVDSRNVMGDTGLIFASRYGNVECLQILLENNVNVNHQNLDNKSALTSCCTGYLAPHTNKPVIQFLLLSCGAEGEEGKESLAEMNTRIIEYHTELMDVLSEDVVVDTRLYLEDHGLYHEPLERVMQYCGLELMLENDPNREEADLIPVLLRGRTRASSALYWWNLFHEMDG